MEVDMTTRANSNPSAPRTALVLGATGGVGGEVMRVLLARGWHVRALARRPPADAAPAVQWIAGDAMRADDVVAAARGADVIVHGVNPPGYKNWRGLALPMLESSLAAARASGARILFPGTVYNFGPDAGQTVGEDAPQHPLTRKGGIRVEMERRLEEASRQGGVRCLIVRAGDYFGPRTRNSWLAQGLVTPGSPLRKVTYPGELTVGHAWAYLPDLAEAMVQLLEHESELGAFERFHFGGHWFGSGQEMVDAFRRVAGRPDLPVRRFPWFACYLAAPFVTVLREMLEMRYLWQRPLRLDNRRLVALLGREPHTPIEEALRVTLEGLGCSLPLQAGPAAAKMSAWTPSA
jgi:nucleoside-diphosphate-sugar epimerase